MRFSITVLLVAIFIVASVADAQRKRRPRSEKAKLSSKFCKYGKKKLREGAVKKFPDYCVELKCEKKGEKLEWTFHKLEDCTCNLQFDAKPIKNSKKSAKCVFNLESGKKGTILESYEDTCMNLVCKASKRNPKYAIRTIPDCVCKSDDYHWGYHGDEDAESWSSYYLNCGGSSQSPVDLINDIAKEVEEKPWELTNYDAVPKSMTLLNNGHTAQVTIEPTGDMPSVTGGGLPGVYEFVQYHFHWGSDSTKGSEHFIDGEAYPLELHLVHYNTKYGAVGDALGESDGLAVLGFMFEVSKDDNPAFDNIISQFKDVEKAGAEVELKKAQSLDSYMDVDKSKFFRYNGSLTTPTCNEAVVWTVFKDPIPISEAQLETFRTTMKDEKEKLIVDNFRPIQSLNKRELESVTV